MKPFYFLMPLLLAASMSQAAETTSEANADDLDIAKVISIEEEKLEPYTCKVVNVKMTYEDSSGETRVHNYRKMASACSQRG